MVVDGSRLQRIEENDFPPVVFFFAVKNNNNYYSCIGVSANITVHCRQYSLSSMQTRTQTHTTCTQKRRHRNKSLENYLNIYFYTFCVVFMIFDSMECVQFDSIKSSVELICLNFARNYTQN